MRTLAASLLVAPLAALIGAQTLHFDVASIKPTSRTDGARLQIQPGGRLVGTRVTASTLVQLAYGRRPLHIDGLPGWTDTERFDLQAKALAGDTPVGSAEVLEMLRSLLAERFGLRSHVETRTRPVYLLVRDRHGPLSSGIRPSTEDCVGRRPENIGVAPGCGIRSHAGPDSVVLTFQGRTLTEFASDLERMVQRPVLDKTGIEGQYDIDLDRARTPASDGAVGATASTFTAVRALGLRLDGEDAPLEVLVVDAIHRPTPD